MIVLGALGFLAPAVLLGLIVLPILWLLLRAVPPAPRRLKFPGVRLLLGLKDENAETDRTPWWLLVLRLCAVGAIIVACAEPILNPKNQQLDNTQTSTPLLILLDGTWADAPDWSARLTHVRTALDEAQSADRLVAVRLATAPANQTLLFTSADQWRASLAGLTPASFLPDVPSLVSTLESVEAAFETLWISAGLDYDGHETLLAALELQGQVFVIEPTSTVQALGPLALTEAGVSVKVHQSVQVFEDMTLIARGPDPSGVERILGEVTVSAENDGPEAQVGRGSVLDVEIELRPELRNRVTEIAILGAKSAAAMRLTGNALKRPKVALIAGGNDAEGPLLLSPLHYLQAAFAPFADVISGSLTDVVFANPDVVVLADVATLSEAEHAQMLEWAEKGGTLLRFSGPRLAASDVARQTVDPLMPVRLRAGGRTIGGAMSWGEPKLLRAFSDDSPFYGLAVPQDVTVTAQIMAQPDPELSGRVIATLADGTPLVTRKALGAGQVVLFHVTANADWSTLPLSGLFVSMLERLSGARQNTSQNAAILAQQQVSPVQVMNGFGGLEDASTLPAISGTEILTKRPHFTAPAGLYQSPDAVIAVNAFGSEDQLQPAVWPNTVTRLSADQVPPKSFKPILLLFAVLALLLDSLATLGVMGRLSGLRRSTQNAALIFTLGFGVSAVPPEALIAQDQLSAGRATGDAFALAAASDVTFAYVLTGNDERDTLAYQGLVGLSAAVNARTSVEPAAPVGVDISNDPLNLFPLLYWPIAAGQPMPTPQGYAKLNAYMRSGGVILFDTADADLAVGGNATANQTHLQTIARNLDIPPLARVPEGHVLTRSFYLLQSFPGRYLEGPVWVEDVLNADQNGAGGERGAFGFGGRLNDNVSPIILGGQDWAAAWATDSAGRSVRPVGRGANGERQREMAYRFGVNLVMYVLTGNYKADQIHIPDLLERLGVE